MNVFSKAKAAILKAAATLFNLLSSAALDAAQLHPVMARRHPVGIEKNHLSQTIRPSGAKLSRKAAKGAVGIARIR